MPYENRWPLVRRLHLLPKSARLGGLAISLIEDSAQDKRAWSFRSQHHTIFVFLGEGPSVFDTHIEGSPSLSETPRPGSIWSVPATRRYTAHMEGPAPLLCEITLGASTESGIIVNLASVANAQDALLYQLALRFADLAGARGNIQRILLTRLAEAAKWHITENYRSEKATTKTVNNQVGLTPKARSLLESHIRDHLGDRLVLDDLADLVGLTTHNLLKRFRTSFGTTPAQYIINERLSQAQILLRRSSLQITEVALATGFYSPSHFCAVFSKHLGITPTAYRRQQ